MSRIVVIQGSARHDGHMAHITQQLTQLSGWDFIDLNTYEISHYDYTHQNRDDDYLKLIERLVTHYDVFVLATPVYWYAMSGVMKVFFDRLTDLLTIEKDLGRQLRGKGMAVITSSGGGHLGEVFWEPFIQSAKYLGMTYLGHQHTLPQEVSATQLESFIALVESGYQDIQSKTI